MGRANDEHVDKNNNGANYDHLFSWLINKDQHRHHCAPGACLAHVKTARHRRRMCLNLPVSFNCRLSV